MTDLTIDAAHAGIAHCLTARPTFEIFIRHESNHPTTSASSLFLLRVSLLSLGFGALLTDTDEAGLRAAVTELPVGVLLALVVANGTLLKLDDVLDGKSGGGAADNVLSSLGSLDILSGGVTLLGLAIAAGKENKALPELLEALDVGLETLLGKVLAARIDRDTNGARKLAGNASSFLS